MKKVRYLTVAVFALSVLTAGCAVQWGNKHGALWLENETQQTLEQAYPVGATKKQDVERKLGAPLHKENVAGFELWKYEYRQPRAVQVAFVRSSIGDLKTATFFFDQATDVLQKVEFVHTSY